MYILLNTHIVFFGCQCHEVETLPEAVWATSFSYVKSQSEERTLSSKMAASSRERDAFVLHLQVGRPCSCAHPVTDGVKWSHAWDQHAVRLPTAHCAPHEQQASVNPRPLLSQRSMPEQQKLLESCSLQNSAREAIQREVLFLPPFRLLRERRRSENQKCGLLKCCVRFSH